jgi:hypothetical protein
MSTETFAAVVNNGKVINMVVVAASASVLAKNPNWIYLGSNSQKVAIGWSYNGTEFTPPPPPPPSEEG